MRLSDHMMTEVGGPVDIGGIFTKTCAAIREAERFELSDDVARAAYNLTKSKPTTLLSALPLSRAPYRKLWLEWRGGLTSGMIKPENKRDPNWAPDPLKQGVLVETDKSGQYGTMTFCWLHRENETKRAYRDEMGAVYSPANIAPLGTLFNWDEDANVFKDALDDYHRRHPGESVLSPSGILEFILLKKYTKGMTDDEIKRWMEQSIFKDWGKFAGLAGERKALQELGRHAMPFIPPHARGFFEWVAQSAVQSEQMLTSFLNQVVTLSWEQDILGEGPFVETVIAMMNSRNAIETRPVDLTGLNRARAKKRRPLFLPYRTTHLRLSQAQTRAFRAGLLSKEDAGRHRVRGHFKIRKTGVYWWSPFFRGDPAKPIQRQEYMVE
jgi:hypothetical protein